MTFWQRSFLAVCAVFIILALVMLCTLAYRTTDVAPPPSVAIAEWPDVGKLEKRPLINHPGEVDLLPLLADKGNEILDALLKLSSVPNIKHGELELSFNSPEAMAAFLRRAVDQGIEVLHSDPRLLSAQVRYNNPVAMAEELRRHAGDYRGATPNYLVWIPGLPAEPRTDVKNEGGRQPFGNSGMEAIGAAADRSDWGKGITLAILDSGVENHPSLSQVKITHHDLVKDGLEFNGHGTAMASLAVGSGDQTGGAAQATHVLDIRVADPNGQSNTALLAQAVLLAVDEGAKVINISMGTSGDSVMLRSAIAYAMREGVVVVAAAGNDQQDALAYPAGYSGVISVGAVDAEGKQAYFSNSGDNLTVSAPGVGIVSAYGADRLVVSSGTSQAAAITSGVVSTLLGWGYSEQRMAETIVKNAQPTGAPKEQVGAGMLHLPEM